MKKLKLVLILVLVIDFVSYSQDTLQEIKVQSTRKSIQKSLTATANTTLLTSKELLKAACCNLAESFETNPSIDVHFSDALTGTKQIKMLGLTSPYLLITEENIPSVRGASQAYGLSFTPGTWIESIQISKGAGSVVNGFESFTGQINTELIKPINDVPFFLNAYGSSDARFEVNTHFNKKITDNWATSLFIHGNSRISKMDQNKDGFLDNPLAKQINILNRWHYSNAKNGWISFINFRYMKDEKQTGELDFNPDIDKGTTTHWGSEIATERYEISSKIGYVFPEMPFQSFGFQNSITSHSQDSYFGLRNYYIKQKSFYSNAIFNSIINNTRHKFTTGLNLTLDLYDEFLESLDYSRKDSSVGAFFEYTYDTNDNFSIVFGGRIDQHNRLGLFVTPRLHMKYNPWEKGVLRFSAGRGKRGASVIAENQSLLASSRQFIFAETGGKMYGLTPEIAWNYGFGLMQGFLLFGKKAEISFDFYRTVFTNQVVVDLYSLPIASSTTQVLFYNLEGKSFANSMQLEFNIELIKHLNLRTAFKQYEIQTDYLMGRKQRPLQPKSRFFANLEFQTHLTEQGKNWRFDCTYNWTGKQPLPSTSNNPIADQLPDFSKSFSILNTQITRVFSSVFEIYVGGENMGNYQQENAIIGSTNPFGTSFDTSINYAPVFGQMFYAGLRYKIK
jgi:outer membrane receptor for ferrienterochelin and colicins